MKKFIIGFILFLSVTCGYASSKSFSNAELTPFDCNVVVLTLSCGAQYEYCGSSASFSGIIALLNDYFIMDEKYCAKDIQFHPFDIGSW